MSMNFNDLLASNPYGVPDVSQNPVPDLRPGLNKLIAPGETTHMDAQFSVGRELFGEKLITTNYYEDLLRTGNVGRYSVNFDTRFRVDMTDSPTDCLFVLPEKINNIIAMRLSSIELPNNFYAFSETNGNLALDLSDASNGAFTVSIGEGNYTEPELVETLSGLLAPYGYQISVAPQTNKVTIANISGVRFDMTTNVGTRCTQLQDWGLGFNLGFRGRTYSGSSSYQGEAQISTGGYDYLFLEFNDFTTGDKQSVISYMYKSILNTKLLGKIILRDGKYQISFDDGRDLLYRTRVYTTPMNLERVRVRVVDPYGVTVDLNHTNFSFTVEFMLGG